MATERPAAAPSRPTSLAAAAALRVASLDASSLAAPQAAPEAAPSESKSFFRSKKGAIALVLMATGVTWAIVSRSKDAVHSPAR